jgi:hypothetical protein
MKPTKSAAVEAPGVEPAAAMKPAAPTMGTSVGGACLTERHSEQQSSCASRQKPSQFGLNSFFA